MHGILEGFDRLAEALAAVLALLDDGRLQRNTVNDHHLPTYMAEASRIVKVISTAQKELAAYRDAGRG